LKNEYFHILYANQLVVNRCCGSYNCITVNLLISKIANISVDVEKLGYYRPVTRIPAVAGMTDSWRQSNLLRCQGHRIKLGVRRQVDPPLTDETHERPRNVVGNRSETGRRESQCYIRFRLHPLELSLSPSQRRI
jgi:hypothetical protein